MRGLRWAIGVPVGLFLLVLASCQIAYPTHTFRYRLTVEVDTPQGLKTGSSVIEVKWKRKTPLGDTFSGGLPWSEKVRGVAPIVDLGPYGTLIAGLWKRGSWWAAAAPTLAYPGNEPGDFTGQEKQAELSGRRLPQFVWYPANEFGPYAAKGVPPDKFSKTIGGGVHLRRVAIEPTRDPVVERLDPKPEWLAKVYSHLERYRKTPRQERKLIPRRPFNLQPTFVHTDWNHDGS